MLNKQKYSKIHMFKLLKKLQWKYVWRHSVIASNRMFNVEEMASDKQILSYFNQVKGNNSGIPQHKQTKLHSRYTYKFQENSSSSS